MLQRLVGMPTQKGREREEGGEEKQWCVSPGSCCRVVCLSVFCCKQASHLIIIMSVHGERGSAREGEGKRRVEAGPKSKCVGAVVGLWRVR